MESNLHRFLKRHYAMSDGDVEVSVGGYRIDAIDRCGMLVEVQHAGLGSIRNKIAELVRHHPVRLVKPLISHRTIRTVEKCDGKLLRMRRSPKSQSPLDIFESLVHFTSVFPNSNLMLEVPVLKIVETRIERVKRWRRSKPYEIIDQSVDEIASSFTLSTRCDLWRLCCLQSNFIPHWMRSVAAPAGDIDCIHRWTFDSNSLAKLLGRPRSFAQLVAYVLLHCGCTEVVGKRQNTKLYRLTAPSINSHLDMIALDRIPLVG